MGTDPPDDRAAFTAWVEPHWRPMATLARRLGGADWEDALQEAFGSAWRKRHQYDATRGTPRTWLLAIVADKVRRTRRIRSADPAGLAGDLPDDLAGDHGVPHRGAPAVDRRETRLDLDRALDRLTDRQRLTVELHYYAGLTVAEVAVVLGCAEGTVKSTLSDARRHLRRRLGEDYR